MSGRRGGNRIRGPQSALTDFLAANNISAAQIRDDYERRRREADQDGDAGEGPSNQAPEQDDDEALAAAAQAEEDEVKSKKRKRSQKDTIDKIKKSKKGAKKGPKKRGPHDDDADDNYDDDLGMYRMARPLPGQLEHCDICNKRFTVTPYSKPGPDGGLLCTPCGKELTKETKKEERAAKKPAGKKRRKVESERLDGMVSGGAKSLVQMCLQRVAQHHDDVEELGDLPAPLLERLSEIFSKKRVMKSKTLKLFLRPDLDSVVVHDAAYLEVEDYQQIFAVVPQVQKLVLSNACQMKDEVIDYMLERCHKLSYLQLYAANLVSDHGWERLFRQGGSKLRTLKLKWLDAAFDDDSVAAMVENCPDLERVKLELCRRITETSINYLTALPKLKHLSLQINSEVSTPVLLDLIHKRGPTLETLSLEKFLDADDSVLDAIHTHCTHLTKLRFSDNDTATDAAFAALFTDWANPPLHFVDFNTSRDVSDGTAEGSDEGQQQEVEPIGFRSLAFASLMAHSGSALRHLDIASNRHIALGAFLDVFSGAHVYPNLEHINLSFCNQVDTSVIAGIFKSCPRLKKLIAFGCFDVRDVIVPGGVALIGVPRAQDAIVQVGTLGMGVEEAIGRMVEVAG